MEVILISARRTYRARPWMGAAELVYCHGADACGKGLAAQASHVPALETQRRRIWR